MARAMSLNGYGWMEGNSPNMVDPSGMNAILANRVNSGICLSKQQTTNVFSFCELRCDYAYPHEWWQQLFWGWDQFNSCVDTCVLGLSSISRTNADCVMSHYRQTNNASANQEAHLPSRYVLFTGSYPGRITEQGPPSEVQMPAWVERMNAVGGYSRRYEGSKASQAQNALNLGLSGDIVVIGYSSGADTAVIFSNQYLMSGAGRITDLVILGGTMSGTMPDGSDLGDSWMCILIDLLNSGTDIYALNDDGADFLLGDDPEWTIFNSYLENNGRHTRGTYNYVLDSRPHYHSQRGVGTNDDPQLIESIFNWIVTW